jgi:hypothetical protein
LAKGLIAAGVGIASSAIIGLYWNQLVGFHHASGASASASGPSLHIAPPRAVGRERGIAEIDRPTSIAEGDARDHLRHARLRIVATQIHL